MSKKSTFRLNKQKPKHNNQLEKKETEISILFDKLLKNCNVLA